MRATWHIHVLQHGSMYCSGLGPFRESHSSGSTNAHYFKARIFIMTALHRHDDRRIANWRVSLHLKMSRELTTTSGMFRLETPADFCGVAHESRYAWVCEHWDLSGKTILDFGCGSGYGTDTWPLLRRLWSMEWIIPKQAIAFAQSQYKKNNMAFFAADASSAREIFTLLNRQSYDLITSFDVIEHIELYRDYLANIATLIKSDGTLIIGCPNRLQTLSWNRTWNPYHRQEFAPRQFREILLDYFDNVVLVSRASTTAGGNAKQRGLEITALTSHCRRCSSHCRISLSP